jgi:hypothetical protein
MMRKLYLSLALSLLVSIVTAQKTGVAINASGLPADSSAMLDVSSNSKGVLISRMNTEQRLAISKPAIGLMVYDTTVNCLCIYSGARWKLICEDII